MSGGLFEAYLAGEVTALYGGHFANAQDRRRAVTRALRPLPARLFDVLQAQQCRLPPCDARVRSLGRLRDGAVAVVTGQQVGLFLGPLYSVYKAASAVRVARSLEEETGTRVVPVFWLQTEDHDLEEIATCHAPRLHGGVATLAVPVPQANRVSVAHCRLPPEVDGALGALREVLQTLPHAQSHLSSLSQWYRPGVPWGQAFAGAFAELFAGTGLLLLDPRDPALAELSAPVHRRAITEASAFSAALLERVRHLEASGFKPPIHVRDGAPLSFFHPDGSEGPRYRLMPDVDGLREVGGDGAQNSVHATEALVTLCDREPARFSTSALLRPILQDTLLPTAAYVGGPGEIAYFAQLLPLYEAFGVPMPLVVPRARFRVFEPRITRTLEGLGLSADELTQPEEALLARLPDESGDVLSPEALEQEIVSGFEEVLSRAKVRAGAVAVDLERAFEKTRGTSGWAASMLRRRYERVLTDRNRTRTEALHRARSFLYPEGAPQERCFGVSWFAARHGGAAFVQRVLDSVVPFDPSQRDLEA